MKKIIIISSIAVILIIAVFFLFFNKSANPYTFRYNEITKGDITVYVTATGILTADTSVDVGTQVSGLVSKLYADFNSVVKKGQVIAQIDTTFFSQTVKDSQANLDKAKAAYIQAERNYVREKALFEMKLESGLNYDLALATLDSDSALVQQAQVELNESKLTLKYATINAPISGVVTNRQISVGQTVASSFSSPTLCSIANDLTKMQVYATVDESDIGSVSVGQYANFTVEAYNDDNFSGTVSQIRLTPQIVQNVVMYTVIIEVNNDSLKLLPGMTADVNIRVGQKKDVMKVSNLALRFQPPASLVDSTKLREMRDSLKSNLRVKSTTAISGQSSPDMLSVMEKNNFQTLKDSILKSYGEKLNAKQMDEELKKAYVKLKISGEQKAPVKVYKSRPLNKISGVSRYPQFQKSPDNLTNKITLGKIWILNTKGMLVPIFVKTGLDDGIESEVISGNITAGEQLVISADTKSGQTDSGQKNPLAGQQQGSGQNKGK
jgi:HlyD family secretion protein